MTEKTKLYGSREKWNIQTESVSINQDDRGFLTASLVYEQPYSISSKEAIAFPAEAKPGGEFPLNEQYNVDLYCHRVSSAMRLGFVSITAYYAGIDKGNYGAGKTDVRIEWTCNTQASPIETHPDYAEKMKKFAIEENGLFVAFPALAPENLGGVTDFLEPAATLRISWVEKYNVGELQKWTKKIGKITDVPSFARFDFDVSPRDFLLNSFSFSFYAKPPEGDPKFQECTLELQMSQEKGWNQLIYKEDKNK